MTNHVDEEVGNRIKLRRLALKITQKQLGKKLGVTFQQVQKYEKGGNRIGAGRLWDIAHALDCTVSSLFGELPPVPIRAPYRLEENPPLTSSYTKEAMELLNAFDSIKSSHQRQLVISIARQLAELQGK